MTKKEATKLLAAKSEAVTDKLSTLDQLTSEHSDLTGKIEGLKKAESEILNAIGSIDDRTEKLLSHRAKVDVHKADLATLTESIKTAKADVIALAINATRSAGIVKDAVKAAQVSALTTHWRALLDDRFHWRIEALLPESRLLRVTEDLTLPIFIGHDVEGSLDSARGLAAKIEQLSEIAGPEQFTVESL